jgi:hypothetical protein
MYDFSEVLINEYSAAQENSSVLAEKWYIGDPTRERVWYSDSISQFRNFLINLPNTDLKGIRICVAPDAYLAARASDLGHFQILDFMQYGIYDAYEDDDIPDIGSSSRFEMASCGIPKAEDFSLDNFEVQRYEFEDEVKDRLVADCGTFEVLLYQFKTDKVPDYVSEYKNAKVLESSEIWRVIKPLTKRLYVKCF